MILPPAFYILFYPIFTHSTIKSPKRKRPHFCDLSHTFSYPYLTS